METSCSLKTEMSIQEKFICWGSTASEAMLDYPYEIFSSPQCIGIIAYRLKSECAIIFGDPICPPEELERLTTAFHDFCKHRNWNVIYIIASHQFAKWAHPKLCKIKIEACEEISFDPESDAIQKSHRLQHRVEEAIKHGLVVKEYLEEDPTVKKAILNVGKEWKMTRKGPQIYLGHLNFFENPAGKRWFYVEEGLKITAMALLCRLEARKGWLLKFIISTPDAFKDTSELLMMTIFETLRKENCRFITYGMEPAPSLGEVAGLNPMATWLAKNIYKLIKKIFKLNQRKAYWERYHPTTEPSYVLFANDHFGAREIKALSKAFKTEL